MNTEPVQSPHALDVAAAYRERDAAIRTSTVLLLVSIVTSMLFVVTATMWNVTVSERDAWRAAGWRAAALVERCAQQGHAPEGEP